MCLMTLSKIAHSTKNATTPIIHIINNSVTISLKFWVQRYKKCRAYINIGVKKVRFFRASACLFRKNPYICTIFQNKKI